MCNVKTELTPAIPSRAHMRFKTGDYVISLKNGTIVLVTDQYVSETFEGVVIKRGKHSRIGQPGTYLTQIPTTEFDHYVGELRSVINV